MPDTPDTKPVLAAEGGATSSADTSLTVPDAAAPSIVTVYELIHSLYVEIVEALDTPMDWDSLSSPMMNYSVIKPIVERYSPKPAKDEHPDNAANCLGAVLYALMANRWADSHIGDRSNASESSSSVSSTAISASRLSRSLAPTFANFSPVSVFLCGFLLEITPSSPVLPPMTGWSARIPPIA